MLNHPLHEPSQRWAQRGFTLVELAVTMMLVGILTALALPPVMEWVAISRLRAAAEALQSSVRFAQAEALRRSRSTALVLSHQSPQVGATPVNNGQRWWVQTLLRSGEQASEQQFLQNSTEPASMNVVMEGPAVLCFNAIGRQVSLSGVSNGLGFDCTAPSTTTTYTSYTFTNTRTTRRMRVQVGLGGEVRMCNPDKTLSDEAPDGCR